MKKNYCLIMAGGSGTRFWPRSRIKKPKQYLTLFGNQTLIKETVQRFANFIAEENIYIVSAKSQQKVLGEQKINLPQENLIYEPAGKNTLPAIALAALFIAKKDPEGIIVVSPSDHLIQNDVLFRQTVESAALIADKTDGIITIGITPVHPSTGYGYVQTAGEVKFGQPIRAFGVKKFVEKPNIEVATGYLKSGGYYWNSGIFVFKVSVFLESVQKYSPALYSDLMRINEFIGTSEYDTILNKIYPGVESVSIDYGILEKASNLFLVQGDFIWNDLGSWEEVYKYDKKDENQNVHTGEVVFLDTKNSYIYAPESLVAVVGLDGIIVVQEGNTILVCKRDRAEEIKQVTGEISKRKLNKYL
jgi:mannose-1-phosphate guanylyltransferase